MQDVLLPGLPGEGVPDEVRAHLERHPEARVEWELRQQLATVLRSSPRRRPSPEATERIRAGVFAVTGLGARSRRQLVVQRISALAAAAVLLLATGLSLHLSQPAASQSHARGSEAGPFQDLRFELVEGSAPPSGLLHGYAIHDPRLVDGGRDR
jgi:hypothetical protein